jgi:transcriptional antiterminator NusG
MTRWWVVNITSGFEQKIKNTIESQEFLRNIDKKILVPVVKRKKFFRDKFYYYSEKLFPGYVFISCEDQDVNSIFGVIAQIPGILNMSGIKGTVRFYDFVDESEMFDVLELMCDHKEKTEENESIIKIDSKVKITDGPFSSFNGIVSEIYKAKNREAKVKVSTSIFDGSITTIVIPISFVEPI